jgi:hypothetical protein
MSLSSLINLLLVIPMIWGSIAGMDRILCHYVRKVVLQCVNMLGVLLSLPLYVTVGDAYA